MPKPNPKYWKPAKRRPRWTWTLLFLPVLVGAYFLLKGKAPGDDFAALAAAGAARLGDTAVPVLENRGHLPLGQEVNYATPTPASGPHSPRDVEPGFYDALPSRTLLVHNLEHGDVVIYYDRPGPEVLATLRRWARRFDQPFQGLVVVPLEGLGAKVVLTAWGQHLELSPFDPELAAAFIDRYRGRGPERKVR